MKTAVVTDSTAYIPKEIREHLHIHMIPLQVIFEGEVYEEEVDLTAEEFYEKVKQVEKLPTTSQPPIGKFVELFQRLAEEYDAVVSIHLSSGISGTYQGALAAAEMVDGIEVYAFDSEISCRVQGFYVLEAAQMALEGKSPQDILARLEEIKKSAIAYFMADDLAHLQRGGRLSSAQALIGSLLQVKPCFILRTKSLFLLKKFAPGKKH